jgi:MFS family permease
MNTFETVPGRLPRSVSFVLVVAIMVLFQAAASAPTPLYVVYQRTWGFSAATVTLIFAIFVFALLCSLLVFGGLSDHVGRRPVLLTAIALAWVGLLRFLTAGDVTALLVARVVQGVATGMVLPTLGAALVDFTPPHSPGRAAIVNGVVPIGGLALGSLVCGALVQYGPDPTHLVWALLLGAMVLAWVGVLFLPASAARRDGALRSLVPRLGVPRRLRGDVSTLAPIIVASWALGGLYLSLGPSAAVAVFGVGDHFVGGLVATLLCGTGAVTAFALRRSSGSVVAGLSVALLTVGTSVTLVGTVGAWIVLAVVGTVVAGVGYGASGLATFGAMATLAGPAEAVERGELFAVGYTVAYLAFSLPAVAAGVAATRAGLHTTLVAYALLVIAVGLAALWARRRARAVG